MVRHFRRTGRGGSSSHFRSVGVERAALRGSRERRTDEAEPRQWHGLVEIKARAPDPIVVLPQPRSAQKQLRPPDSQEGEFV